MATLRLCDFGDAADTSSKGTALVGDMAYRAPEVWARAYSRCGAMVRNSEAQSYIDAGVKRLQ